MYQFKREPLTQDEATRLANACQTHQERLVVWTLLDTDLRVAELAYLKRSNIDWRGHRLMIYGKGGPYATKSKRGTAGVRGHELLRTSLPSRTHA